MWFGDPDGAAWGGICGVAYAAFGLVFCLVRKRCGVPDGCQCRKAVG